jgi:MFS family permease
MAVGLIVIGIGPAPLLAVSAAALLGLGFSFPWSSVASTVLRNTPQRERGSAVGVLSAFYDLFVGISSLAAGGVASRYGYSAAFFMAAGSLIAAAVAGQFVFPAGQPEQILPDAPERVLEEV